MKIFKASLLALAFIVSIGACKPKQSVASTPKNETMATSADKIPLGMPVAKPAKTDSAYAVFSVDRARKTVYRGMKNPLTIVVPNAVWIKAEGNGLMKLDEFGHYQISPGMGTKAEIKITAGMPDGSTFHETRSINIRNVPNPKVYLSETITNGSLTEEQLKKAEVQLVMADFDYDMEWTVTSFEVMFPYGKKVKVKGNKLDSKALELLKKIKHNVPITISNVAGESSPQTTILFRPDPITIKVNKKAPSKK